jgi:hypothetical protein
MLTPSSSFAITPIWRLDREECGLWTNFQLEITVDYPGDSFGPVRYFETEFPQFMDSGTKLRNPKVEDFREWDLSAARFEEKLQNLCSLCVIAPHTRASCRGRLWSG